MKMNFDNKFPPDFLGTILWVSFPDKGEVILNLTAVVMVLLEEDFYRVGNSEGILNRNIILTIPIIAEVFIEMEEKISTSSKD